MTPCLFATDLHGRPDRYEKLFAAIRSDPPAALFLGGDLLPHGALGPAVEVADFLDRILIDGFRALRQDLRRRYPEVFLILGNDDGRDAEADLEREDFDGLWHYAHGKRNDLGSYPVFGYAYVPPTPFRIKDWERYDVSRYTDPGCLSPEEGATTIAIDEETRKLRTITRDLEELAPPGQNLDRAIFLFHTPPYQSNLDRAALDGQEVDHVPLDPNIGSIAVRRFLEERGPLISLHGHVHESARLTGQWRDRIGATYAFSAAHDGPELALVRFAPEAPEEAVRVLI